jgi:hypothetical protein
VFKDSTVAQPDACRPPPAPTAIETVLWVIRKVVAATTARRHPHVVAQAIRPPGTLLAE